MSNDPNQRLSRRLSIPRRPRRQARFAVHPSGSHGGAYPALIILLAIVFAAAGALSAGYWLAPKTPKFKAAKLYPEPRTIGDFTLTAADGTPFELARWNGAWDLVFFGFTHCPDVCPSTLNDLKAVAAELRKHNLQPPRVTFISVDPERDQGEQLKRYVEYFNPDFQSATGPHEQLQALTRRLGVIYQIEPHEPGAAAYNVDHSTALLVIDPQARLRAVFPAPHRVEWIVADLATLIQG